MSLSYFVANQSTIVAGTGTIGVTGTAMTGSGSAFLSEIAPGDVIHASGYDLAVATVANDTTATVAHAPASNFSGQSFTIAKLSSGVVAALTNDSSAPLGDFHHWMATIPLGDSLERAVGRPHASWLWKNVGVLQRAALNVFCPGKSARVYICTLNDPSVGTFAVYDAVMLWPDNDNAYNQDFVIEFRDLVTL